MPKITDKLVRGLGVPQNTTQLRLYDDEIKGFGVRITKAGAKSFILNYHVNGRERRTTIGRYPAWSVAAAREEASRLRRIVDVGNDPLAEKQSRRSKRTIRELWERYRVDVSARKAPSTHKDECALWERRILPVIGDRAIEELTHSDIDRLHTQITRAAPVRANRAVSALSHALNMARRWDWCERNVAKGVRKNPEAGRERYLSTQEVLRLMSALNDRAGNTTANLIKFILFTGCRRGEAFKATWDEFDLDGGWWVKPSHHTKMRRKHSVPISGAVIQLLRNLKSQSMGSLVFPGRDGKQLKDIKRMWGSVCRSAEIEDVRVHDLRHSFASALVSSGEGLPTIGRLLGHTQTSTTARYAHLYDEKIRDAVEWVAKKFNANQEKKR